MASQSFPNLGIHFIFHQLPWLLFASDSSYTSQNAVISCSRSIFCVPINKQHFVKCAVVRGKIFASRGKLLHFSTSAAITLYYSILAFCSARPNELISNRLRRTSRKSSNISGFAENTMILQSACQYPGWLRIGRFPGRTGSCRMLQTR